jgi:xanthine dehydrogenase iron-sulfur cluster and FAD-binding subunit A
VWADGKTVLTVEGLSRNGQLDPVQEAFIAHDAPQCGFCTSGQIMAARGLLNVNPTPDASEVRAALSGNLCRCANYNRIVEAVVAAGANGAGRRRSGGARGPSRATRHRPGRPRRGPRLPAPGRLRAPSRRHRAPLA